MAREGDAQEAPRDVGDALEGRLSALETRLDALEGDGARGFDAPACDCVRRLIVDAERLGGGASERLIARADDHLQRLEARFVTAREKAEAQLARVRAEGLCDDTSLDRSLERGELTRVRRVTRRARASSRPPALQRVEAATEAPARPLERRRRSAIAYEDSAAELVASFTLARSADSVPPGAGPYNGNLIAYRALDAMRAVSPLYLRAQIERLDELGRLLALPEPPVESRPPPRRPARSRGKPSKSKSK